LFCFRKIKILLCLANFYISFEDIIVIVIAVVMAVAIAIGIGIAIDNY